jgi:hypothetical protein
MRSVADDLRAEARADDERLTSQERVELALRLGDEDLEAFRRARGLDVETARRLLQLQRQTGRQRSQCILDLLS